MAVLAVSPWALDSLVHGKTSPVWKYGTLKVARGFLVFFCAMYKKKNYNYYLSKCTMYNKLGPVNPNGFSNDRSTLGTTTVTF